MLLYYWPDPAHLYQFVCYTILVGRHFTLKINDDCLPCFLYKSFFYGRKVRKEKVERRGYFKILFDKRMKNQWLKIPVPCFFWSGAQEVCCFYIYQKNSAMTLLWQKPSGKRRTLCSMESTAQHWLTQRKVTASFFSTNDKS